MANDAETYAGQLGFAAYFFSQDPELSQLIQNAVNGQWDTQKFQAAFMNTNWYRTRTASQREWEDMRIRDPQELQRKITEKMAIVRDKAGQLGLGWTEDYINEVSQMFLHWGLSDKEQTDFYASRIDYTPGKMGGTPAAVEMQVNKAAGDYGLKLTNSQVSQYVSGIMHESYTEDNIKSFMKDMAKSKYAGMAGFLDQGMTVRQVAAPYVSSYSNLLEVNGDTVDLNDNIIQQALQGTPAAPGQPPQMKSVYQFERDVRRDPRWLRTKNARDSIVSAGQGVLKDMGLVG